MNSRIVASVAIYLVACSFLFIAIPQDRDEPIRMPFVIAGGVVYLVLILLRNRYFPRHATSQSQFGLLGLFSYLRRPDISQVISLVLVGAPFLLVYEIGPQRSGRALDAMAEIYPYWAALVTSAILLWMHLPKKAGAPIVEWWIPVAFVMAVAVAGITLVPDMLSRALVSDSERGGGGLAPLALPLAALSWRLYEYWRIRRT